MNRDSEDIQRRILMLLQGFPAPASSPDVESAHQAPGCNAIAQSAQHPSDLLSPRPMNSSTSDFSESNRSFPKEPSLELGDVPVVQERFQALLKNRLQSEIQKNPPLFPWETEMLDYGNELDGAIKAVPAAQPGTTGPAWAWLRQLRNLKLRTPAHIPEPILASLLRHCQDVVQLSLQDGAKLVRAVEELFPGQQDLLNRQANDILMAAARSPQTVETATDAAPIEYDAVTPTQQIALSLLAAREILNTLSLKVSAAEPIVDRQWQTDVGVLAFRLEYGPSSSIRIQAMLPTGGMLVVRNGIVQTTTQRATAGRLSAELFDCQPNHAYTVEFYLSGIDQPLTFALQID